MEMIAISHEEISMNTVSHFNHRRSSKKLKGFSLLLIILIFSICFYLRSSPSPLMSNAEDNFGVKNDSNDISQLSSEEVEIRYKDILSSVLYQPFLGALVSNSTIQANNVTFVIIQFIFRQYSFSSSFNYDIVLYGLENFSSSEGIIISNNQPFSSTSNQSNSMNFSIDDDSFTLSSTQEMSFKLLSKTRSQPIMMNLSLKFLFTFNQTSLNGNITLETDNKTITFSIIPSEIDFYSHSWYTIITLYSICLYYILIMMKLNDYNIIPALYSPYTVLFYTIYSGALLYQISHLMFISKVYLYFVPLFFLQLLNALYWYPNTLLYIINNQIYLDMTHQPRYKQIAICFVLYVTILSLLIGSINYSYCYRWRIVYYILLISTEIPQMIHIRYYNDEILKYFNLDLNQLQTQKIYLILLQKYKANVFIYGRNPVDSLVTMMIILIELCILKCLKHKNWIKMNIFKMEWYEVYWFLNELKSKENFECSICLDSSLGDGKEKEPSNNALVVYQSLTIEVKQGKFKGFISGLFCCFRRKNTNMKTFNEETVLITDCQHTFHMVCLERWLKKSEKCPICRAIII